MGNSNLLITGSIAIDTIETPSEKMENVLGGSVTYALAAAQRYCPTSVVGIIGSDFPDEDRELYQSLAVNLDDLQEVEGATFQWGGRYHENWNDRETLYTELGVFADFSPRLSAENKSVNTALLANIHPALQQSVIDQCSADLIVLDTMNLWINTTRAALDEVLRKTSILLLNESEAELLTGISNPEKAGQKLMEYGMEKIVVKLGSHGAILFDSENQIRIGAYPVKNVVDPTGAGDVFAGAFAGVLHSNGAAREALVQASALASICVEGFGVDKILEVDHTEITKRTSYLEGTLDL
ncbi:MAG TPA: sugar kinase [Candidatus Marinimicrobia bacterium]|nr:sugar kinase [Candidatus Neomarinimicrobiota bacterium]